MIFIAYEQAPRWGIGRNEKIGERAERGTGATTPFSPPLQDADFCLRPIPHLGTCSQAGRIY